MIKISFLFNKIIKNPYHENRFKFEMFTQC